jgi:uncharacterized membrane protein YbhN (UPF0104 family)
MRPWLRTTLKVCVTVAIVYYLFVSLGETVTELPKAFGSVSWKALAVAFALNLIGTVVLPGFATHVVVARQGMKLGWTELLRINFVTRFYVLFLPRGAALAVRWDRYRRAGSASDALALVMFERLTTMFIYLLLAIFCLGFEYAKLPRSAGPILAVLVLALGVPAALLLPFTSESAAKLGASVLERLRPRLWPFLVRGLERQMQAVMAYRSLSGRDVLSILGLTTLGYFCFVSSAYALSAGMAFGLTFFALGWIRSIVFVITLIPISIAGIGVRELGFVELLALYGTPRAEALAFAVLLFSIQLLIGGVGGLLELSNVVSDAKRKLSDLRR